MNLLDILREGWKNTWGNKLIVPLSFLLVASNLVSRLEESDQVLSCLFQILGFIGIILEGIIIYVIYQNTRDNQISGRDLLDEISPLIGRLVLIVIPLGFVYLIFLFLFRIVLLVLHLDSYPDLVWMLTIIFLSPLFIGFTTFALCGVVINNLGVLRGTFNALLITTNNPISVFVLAGLFMPLLVLLLLVEVLPFIRIATLMDMGSLNSMYSAIRAILANEPFAYLIDLAGGMVISPFILGVFTVAYLRFTSKVRYPGIDGDQSAA